MKFLSHRYRLISPAWLVLGCWLTELLSGAVAPTLEYRVKLQTIQAGFDGKTGWHGPRVTVVPGVAPVYVLTLQQALMGVSDVFFGLSDMQSIDLGRTWSKPVEHSTMGWRDGPEDSSQGIAGITPKWHAASGRVLGTGSTAHYSAVQKMPDPSSRPAYVVCDPAQRTWSRWTQLALPNNPKLVPTTPYSPLEYFGAGPIA